MNDDTLTQLAAEIARQDAAFAAFKDAVTAFGDDPIAVPTEMLEELDALTAPAPIAPTTPLNGLRA